MSNISKPKTARELAQRVLRHPRGGFQALLELAGGGENEWLEFKAASCPKGGEPELGKNDADYRWNVAKAVVAMANSLGGVVFLGVDDQGRAVGIEASDPKGKRDSKGMEAFIREEIMERVLLPKGGWKTEQKGTFKPSQPALLERLIAPEEVRCGNKTVLAIFVDPTERQLGHVEIEQTKHGSRLDPVLYVRKRGEVGQVVELPRDGSAVIDAHDAQRQSAGSVMAAAWDRFLASASSARLSHELLPDIRRNIAETMDRVSSLYATFTPLRVVQRGAGASLATESARKSFREEEESWLGETAERPATEELRPEPAVIRGLATDLLGKKRRALLIGEGGAGKSRCLAALAFELIKGWEPGRVWPLQASLSEYATDGLSGLLQQASGIDWQDLAPLVAAGEVALYLDGLNECAADLHDSCLTEITAWLTEYPQARIYLTTRATQVPEGLGLTTFEIEPLDRAQQVQLLEGCIGKDGRATEILDKFYDQPGASVIAGSPILLRIVAAVASDLQDIPAGRAALYRRYIDTWCRREAITAAKSGRDLPWAAQQVIRALSDLAYLTRRDGVGTVTVRRARDIVLPILGEETEPFLDWVCQGTILTRNPGTGTISFWHETIQEYLCGAYLAAHHEDLNISALADRVRPGIWAMPIAFAIELLDKPSRAFVDAAWQVEPLVVAASARVSMELATAPVEGDLWTRGVLKALLGRAVEEEARAITIIARLPPKYQISPYLLSTLRSSSFWYAAKTHSEGVARLEGLRRLVCGHCFPWIELLPAALEGNVGWETDLSPALRAIAGIEPPLSLAEVLSTATVSELCALRRAGRISAGTFLSSWAGALDQSSGSQLELDIIDILRSEKERVDDIVRAMLRRYKAELRSVADEPTLSLRVLSILVRGKVIGGPDLRGQPGRLANICAKMSLMNAIRLAKLGVIRRGDIDEDTLGRLIFDKSTKIDKLAEAVRVGLLMPDDLPIEVQRRIAASSSPAHRPETGRKARHALFDLVEPKSRAATEILLGSRRWEVTLKRIPPEGNFAFARHSDFDADIFCPFPKLSPPNRSAYREGERLDVRIATRFDDKKKKWGYAVVSGQRID